MNFLIKNILQEAKKNYQPKNVLPKISFLLKQRFIIFYLFIRVLFIFYTATQFIELIYIKNTNFRNDCELKKIYYRRNVASVFPTISKINYQSNFFGLSNFPFLLKQNYLLLNFSITVHFIDFNFNKFVRQDMQKCLGPLVRSLKLS